MVKRLRFQETRKLHHRRDRAVRGPLVLEPMDMVMVAIAVAVLAWLSVMMPI